MVLNPVPEYYFGFKQFYVFKYGIGDRRRYVKM